MATEGRTVFVSSHVMSEMARPPTTSSSWAAPGCPPTAASSHDRRAHVHASLEEVYLALTRDDMDHQTTTTTITGTRKAVA